MRETTRHRENHLALNRTDLSKMQQMRIGDVRIVPETVAMGNRIETELLPVPVIAFGRPQACLLFGSLTEQHLSPISQGKTGTVQEDTGFVTHTNVVIIEFDNFKAHGSPVAPERCESERLQGSEGSGIWHLQVPDQPLITVILSIKYQTVLQQLQLMQQKHEENTHNQGHES